MLLVQSQQALAQACAVAKLALRAVVKLAWAVAKLTCAVVKLTCSVVKVPSNWLVQ